MNIKPNRKPLSPKIKSFGEVAKYIPTRTPFTRRSKSVFEEKCRALIAADILEAFDIDNLIIYSVALDQWLTAAHAVQKEGLLVPKFGRYGEPTPAKEQSPYLRAMRDLAGTINTIGKLYGFTPVGRGRVDIDALAASARKTPHEILYEGIDNEEYIDDIEDS